MDPSPPTKNRRHRVMVAWAQTSGQIRPRNLPGTDGSEEPDGRVEWPSINMARRKPEPNVSSSVK